MAHIISIGSGKGGVGKSVLSCNIALSLAAKNYKVILIDLDSGGADAHIMFGHFNPTHTISDFLLHNVENLSDVILNLPEFKGLQLIPGMGETLFTANLPTGSKRRLINHIKKLEADFIIIDVGAGTHVSTLDYFMMAHLNICLTTTDPTSILDLYRFVKLAVIRKALSVFIANDDISKLLKKSEVTSIDEIIKHAELITPDKVDDVLSVIKNFTPALVFNQVTQSNKSSQLQLKKLLFKFVGIKKIPVLGEISSDRQVSASVKAFQPVIQFSPKSKAAYEIGKITNNIIDLVSKS